MITALAFGGRVRARIVRVGNSRGIRLPKSLLDETGLPEEVEITAKGDSLVIRPARRARDGWAEAFSEMAKRGDDRLLDLGSLPSTSWDVEEWSWD